jgi:hypothetical protein
LKEAEKESFSLLVSIIKDCIQIEKIQPEDPELLSLAAWSMVHGIAQFHLEKQLKFQELSDLDTHKLSSKLVQFLYAGMKA